MYSQVFQPNNKYTSSLQNNTVHIRTIFIFSNWKWKQSFPLLANPVSIAAAAKKLIHLFFFFCAMKLYYHIFSISLLVYFKTTSLNDVEYLKLKLKTLKNVIRKSHFAFTVSNAKTMIMFNRSDSNTDSNPYGNCEGLIKIVSVFQN